MLFKDKHISDFVEKRPVISLELADIRLEMEQALCERLENEGLADEIWQYIDDTRTVLDGAIRKNYSRVGLVRQKGLDIISNGIARTHWGRKTMRARQGDRFYTIEGNQVKVLASGTPVISSPLEAIMQAEIAALEMASKRGNAVGAVSRHINFSIAQATGYLSFHGIPSKERELENLIEESLPRMSFLGPKYVEHGSIKVDEVDTAIDAEKLKECLSEHSWSSSYEIARMLRLSFTLKTKTEIEKLIDKWVREGFVEVTTNENAKVGRELSAQHSNLQTLFDVNKYYRKKANDFDATPDRSKGFPTVMLASL